MCLGSAKDAALASHWGDREQRREEDHTAGDTAQSQERHWPTEQSRRRHHPGLTPDWLRAHAHFHSALPQRLLQQLIRTHPTPTRCSLVLRYIGLSSLSFLFSEKAPPTIPAFLPQGSSFVTSSSTLLTFHFLVKWSLLFTMFILSFMSKYRSLGLCALHNFS